MRNPKQLVPPIPDLRNVGKVRPGVSDHPGDNKHLWTSRVLVVFKLPASKSARPHSERGDVCPEHKQHWLPPAQLVDAGAD